MVNGECADGVIDARQVQGRPLQDRGARPVPHPDRRSTRSPTSCATRSSTRRTCRCKLHLPQPVLPLGGRQLRQGHARHDPPAPVRQGRDRADRATRSSRPRRTRSSRATPRRSCKRLELPYRVMLLCTGDIGLRQRQDLRPRGVAAGAGRLPRDLVVLELRGASRRGACRRASATSKGKVEPLHTLNGSGLAVGPHAGRGAGELPERRRLGHGARRRWCPTWAARRNCPRHARRSA